MEKDANKSLEAFDLDKAYAVFRKSIIWIMLILLTTNVIAYLYVRWTKPLYESQSELKLDVKSEASELGLPGINDNSSLNVISGEIELLKSRLFFDKVIQTIDLSISYYTSGNVLIDEKFKTSPFIVDYNLKDPSLYDRRIYLTIIDDHNYTINFTGSENEDSNQKFRFGQKVSNNQIDLSIYLTDYYEPKGDKNFFFVINSKEAQIQYIARNISVEPLNLNANTIKVGFRDYNAQKARDLVNAIDTLYLNYTEQEKNLENNQKIEWLNKELRQIEMQLEGYENYFENFTIENRTNNLDVDLQQTILAINMLDSQKYELNKKINITSELLTKVKNESSEELLNNNLNVFPISFQDKLVELQELVKKKKSIQLSYSDSTFAVKRLNLQITELQNSLISHLESLKESYQKDRINLNNRQNALEKDFIELPEKSTEFNKNERFFKLYEEFYLSLMQSKAQYQIAQAGTTTDFKILSPAFIPTAPISPNVRIIQGIGMVSGLVLSLLFVMLRYVLHNSINGVKELERLTSAPILGSVPKSQERIVETQLIIHKRPKSAVSESLRTIRTNIEFLIPKDKKKVIAVTSTVSGEGKTFISVNLSGIIAASKKKVIVLDLDMRKPRVHSAFNSEESSKGVSTILIDRHTIAECIQKSAVENLDFIPAGPTPPNPSELLINGEFDQLLEQLKLQYDIVVLDTPPVGLVTDGVIAMKKADVGLYIVRSNYSKKIFMNTLNKLVKVNNFNNLAVIMNATSIVGARSYGYGYYEEKPKGFINKIKHAFTKGV
ncbi:polysaccharide biosynthesis tyrosine autokinase [Fulvivirga maritima]|uniref:GumC family protein n=1 Tax=Fulvivirga maritima TaxID=2904247 RepID=UPI001F291665|nr:tyrosine-protein kinase [Fulvivirga maritima]UII27305.1 polysaccharide biosynthesis tyrosine autokinase [Fulvivirga maritima]